MSDAHLTRHLLSAHFPTCQLSVINCLLLSLLHCTPREYWGEYWGHSGPNWFELNIGANGKCLDPSEILFQLEHIPRANTLRTAGWISMWSVQTRAQFSDFLYVFSQREKRILKKSQSCHQQKTNKFPRRKKPFCWQSASAGIVNSIIMRSSIMRSSIIYSN